MPKETFYILDGNAILHRAWHALPPLATKSGKMVNAVYGFLLILLKLLRENKPNYLVVTFDLAGPTFRHEAYEEYKAQRVKAPDELYEQLPIIKEVLKAFEIPIFEKPGYEADDLIGTISQIVSKNKEGIDTYIVTGDLDTMQLVGKNVFVLTFARGIREAQVYDEAAVLKRYGLRPDQMIDYKALRGDPSDNIKGVKGIGEKTATELLQTFGAIEEIYKNIKSKSEKVKKIKAGVLAKLIDGEEDARMSKKLVTILHNVEINFSLENAKVSEIDKEKIFPIFQELGFQTLVSKLPGINAPETEDRKKEKSKKKNYQLLKTKKEVQELLQELNKADCFSLRIFPRPEDIFSKNFLGCAFGWGAGEAACVPQESILIFREILENGKKIKVGHDLKDDLHFLKNIGINLAGPVSDTMVASYLLSPGSRAHELKNLVFEFFGKELAEPLIQGTLLPLRIEDVYNHFCLEADYIFQMRGRLDEDLKKREQTKLFKEIEMPLIESLAAMESYGVKIDISFLKKMSDELNGRIKEISENIYEYAGEEFNINSPIQLKKVLFETLKITTKVRKTAGGSLSTAAGELERMRGSHPIIDLISEYRELSKLTSTYVDALPRLVRADTGRLHSTFNQTVASTGRLSSSEPNLQNIPIRTELGAKIRKGFIAEEGYVLLSADYSQIELRLVAVIARAKKMLEAFRSGADIHTTTAAEIWNIKPEDVTKEQRRAAKAINFGIVYGIGPTSLAESAGISFGEAKEFIQRYFDLYPELKDYLDETKALAASAGYVETIFGRRRYLPEITSGVPPVRAAAERMAINAPVQGSAADLMKMAMIAVFQWIEKEFGVSTEAPVKMLLQVHDEMVLEVKKELAGKVAKKIKEIMEHVHEFAVPIVVEVESGRSWGELKEILL